MKKVEILEISSPQTYDKKGKLEYFLNAGYSIELYSSLLDSYNNIVHTFVLIKELNEKEKI